MPKIICIVGLPCSGKSHLALKISRENGFIAIDDLKDIKILRPYLNSGNNIVLVDLAFCTSEGRDDFNSYMLKNYSKYEIKWIFFENDLVQCSKNLEIRKKSGDDRDVENTLFLFSKLYKIPCNNIALKVYNGLSS